MLSLCSLMFSCRRTNVTEVRPISSTYQDSSKVLMVADEYPCMKLVTGNVVHLHAKGLDETQPYGIIQNGDPLALKCHYLPLETREECLVGQISQLDSDDSSVFILDTDNSSALRFSLKDGSFICKYGSSGRGPGEYISLDCMTINKKSKEVCLLDFSQYKLMYFSYDGELLREEPQYYAYSRMEFCGENMVYRTGRSQNDMAPGINHSRLVLAKTDQTPLFRGFPFAEHSYDNFNRVGNSSLHKCKDDVFYTYEMSDTIWQIKENGVCEAKYVFKFPGRDNLFDENDFLQMTNDVYEKKTKDSPFFAGNITITDNFIRAQIYNGQAMLYCISTGHYHYGHPSNRYFDGVKSFEGQLTLDGTSFVDVLQPFEILKHKESIKAINEATYNYFWNERLTEEERQLLQKMTPESNPILAIIDVEPF